MEKLLYLMEQHPTLSSAQLSSMLDISVEEVEKKTEELTNKGVIRGYRAIIDWDKVEHSHVRALIEIKVTPKKGRGFDEVAQIISEIAEVEAVTLISGGYDLLVEIRAKSFQDIAMLVAKRLSPIEDVTGTATHFVLRPYKLGGVVFCEENTDERGFDFI